MCNLTAVIRHLAKISAILIGIFAVNQIPLIFLRTFVIIHKNYLEVAVFLVLWLACLSSPMVAAYSSRRWTRWMYAVLMPLLNMTNDICYRIMGESLNPLTTEMILNNFQLTNQVGGAYLQSALMPLGFAGIMGFGIALSPNLNPSRLSRLGWLWPILVGILVSGPITQNLYFTDEWPGFYVTSSCLMKYMISRPDYRKDEVSLPWSPSARRARHLVLIIDESVRGDFIDLNSGWNTTPWLKAQKDVVNFGLATSGANCSAESNLILRNGANPHQLYDQNRTILNNPGIWKYAHLAGYRTVYIDGQMPEGRLHSYMTLDEKRLIDEFIFMAAMPVPGYDRDIEAARIIHRYLRSPTPSLIIFNKYGVHFHYEHAYPRTEDLFRPHLDMNEFPSDRTRMVNSYRNAVRWAVDHFLQFLLRGEDLSQSVVFYTSDHGQNLLDDGKQATQCRGQNATPQEAVVPLMVFTGIRDLKSSFQLASGNNMNKTSHFQIFPTLLILMGFRSESVTQRYYLSLFDSAKEEIGFRLGGAFRSGTWRRFDMAKYLTEVAETSSPGKSNAQ